MGLFGSSGDGGAAAAEAQRQAAISQGMTDINNEFAGFTPDFFKQAATNYTDYTTPQLMTQFSNTKNNLTGALGRAGLLTSSAGVQENSALKKELGLQESQIANNAQQQSNQLQGQVATQKSNLVNELESSADPTAINEQAQGAVSQLREPTAIQPLGNLFADWSQQWLGSQTGAINNTNNNTVSALQQILGNSGMPSAGAPAGSSYFVP